MVPERALEPLFTRNKDNENQRSIRLTALVATYTCLTVSAGDTPYSGTNFPANTLLLANTRLSLLPEQYSHLDSAENHMMQCSRHIQQYSSGMLYDRQTKINFSTYKTTASISRGLNTPFFGNHSKIGQWR